MKIITKIIISILIIINLLTIAIIIKQTKEINEGKEIMDNMLEGWEECTNLSTKINNDLLECGIVSIIKLNMEDKI